ncbi:hypothetical protein ACFPRL_10225 [Pseudoclavibacter helvolus]
MPSDAEPSPLGAAAHPLTRSNAATASAGTRSARPGNQSRCVVTDPLREPCAQLQRQPRRQRRGHRGRGSRASWRRDHRQQQRHRQLRRPHRCRRRRSEPARAGRARRRP